MTIVKRLGLGLVCAWFLLSGAAHFAMPDWYASTVPRFVDAQARLPLVFATGGLQIVGALALLSGAMRRAARVVLTVWTICATPVIAAMIFRPEEFPQELVALRLAWQALLLVLILWAPHVPKRHERPLFR